MPPIRTNELYYVGGTKMDKIAVLIPCYNEEKTIEKVIRDYKDVLPEATIYVYNNLRKECADNGDILTAIQMLNKIEK